MEHDDFAVPVLPTCCQARCCCREGKVEILPGIFLRQIEPAPGRLTGLGEGEGVLEPGDEVTP